MDPVVFAPTITKNDNIKEELLWDLDENTQNTKSMQEISKTKNSTTLKYLI